MIKNLFYFTNINSIGGVETFYWYLAQKYKDWDIAIVYKTGDQDQINRLRKLVRVIKFDGQRFQCERAFFNYTIDIIDYVDAKEYIQIIHGDYKSFNITPASNSKITRWIGVSQLVCDTFEEVTGHKVEKVYNPIMVREPRKVLNLISATRLTREKGKDRMVTLGNALDKANIPYTWTIYTDDMEMIRNPNIIYRKPRLDIIDYIASADYLVQLSSTEGYCFSVVEALTVGTPVIVTECPVFEEIGVVSGKNGFVLPFDMSIIPIPEIVKGLPAFKYTPKADTWDKVLAKGESQYQKDMLKQVQIVITKPYYDLQLDRKCEINDVITVNKVRADYIIESGYARMRNGN